MSHALNILSGGAAHGLVGSLTPTFQALTGFGIEGEFGAVGAMADKLRAGHAHRHRGADGGDLLPGWRTEKLVVPASISDVGLVETAMAVRSGDPLVSVGDAAALARGVPRGGCDLRS